jgi:cytochrome c oxidase cbb3-type subunit 2
MKNGPLFFIGLVIALGFSWVAIVLGSNAQLGGLAPYYDDTQSSSYPAWMPGVAAEGQLVYRAEGCASCHTQQVRRPGFGADDKRGWGERQSVARDYIYEPAPQIGEARVGPDLRNLADRKPTPMDAADLYALLYKGQGGMPAYKFLFEKKKVIGQVSDQALQLTGADKPAPGYEVVPTLKTQLLVAYLLNHNSSYDYPEAKPVADAPKEEEKKK